MTECVVSPGVWAVVVSFRCDWEHLAQQFARLLEQVQGIVWVDNGSGFADMNQWLSQWPADRVLLVPLACNQGIALAQNQGIERALSEGATHVLLMDHDSLPLPHMVTVLRQALDARPDAAAAGPCYADARRNKHLSPFVSRQGWRSVRLDVSDPERVWPVDDLIASGCLMPATALRQVGLMRGDFFIDWVDIEWCLRAKSMGWGVYGVCGAALEHRLGDQVAKVWGREIPVHAPWRHYYQARNFVLMLRSVRMPWGTRLNLVRHQVIRCLVFSGLVPGRWQYAKMWVLGLWHGVRGLTGPRMLP